MNIADIFYIIAIIFMVVHTLIVLSIILFIFKAVKSMQRTKAELVARLHMFHVAKYSMQLSVLKNIFKFFKKRGGGEYL